MERRDVAIAIILSIVTCGIYAIYWLYKIAEGFYVTPTQERVNTTPGTTILLWIVTCGIYGYYCYYKWGRASVEISARYGLTTEDKGILYLLLAIFGLSIVNDALIQSDFNNWLSYPPPGGQYQTGGQYQNWTQQPPPGTWM